MTSAYRNLLAVAAAAALLSACSSKDKICPSASPLAPDAVSLTAFKAGAPMDLSSALYNVQVVKVNGDCSVDKAGHTVDSSVDISFRATRAPNGEAVDYAVPYFVAVAGSDGKIVAKYSYSVEFSFAPGQASANFSDSVGSIVIKLGDKEQPYSYDLYAGLQLTKEQLDYNRTLGRYAQ